MLVALHIPRRRAFRPLRQCVLDTGLPVHPSWRGDLSTEPLGFIWDGNERLEWREDLRGPDRICGDRDADAGPILFTDRLSGAVTAGAENTQRTAY